MVRGSTLVVSDLHADTWTDRKIRQTGKSKQEHFFDLLDAAEQVGVGRVVINGDLIDLPPYEGHLAFGHGPCPSRQVIERLIAFGAKVPVTYVFGNHDIGVSGFRCMGADNVTPLRNLTCSYPAYCMDFPNSTVLVEHGHFCDPALILYLRDLANRTYRESHFDEFFWAMQRRKEAAPEKPASPGALETVTVQPGENAYFAAKVGQKSLPKETFWSRLVKRVKSRLGRELAPTTAEWWWRHGIDRMEEYLAKARAEGKSLKPTLYQIFGHTHRADPREAVVHEGVNCTYINAGTWTEAADEGWYLDINPDGKVWLQDWINEPAELKRVGVA